MGRKFIYPYEISAAILSGGGKATGPRREEITMTHISEDALRAFGGGQTDGLIKSLTVHLPSLSQGQKQRLKEKNGGTDSWLWGRLRSVDELGEDPN